MVHITTVTHARPQVLSQFDPELRGNGDSGFVAPLDRRSLNAKEAIDLALESLAYGDQTDAYWLIEKNGPFLAQNREEFNQTLQLAFCKNYTGIAHHLMERENLPRKTIAAILQLGQRREWKEIDSLLPSPHA